MNGRRCGPGHVGVGPTIEQAKGIIIVKGGRTPDEAFQMVVRASQRENCKLRDLAAEIVDGTIQRNPPPRA